MSTDTSVPGPRVSGLAASDSALFATLIKEAPMGFAFFDTGLRCHRINDTLAGLLGSPVAELVDRVPGEIMPEGPAATAAACLREVISTDRSVIDKDLRFEVPPREEGEGGSEGPAEPDSAGSAEVRCWATSWFPSHGPDGKLLGVALIAVDVTERRLDEEQIRRKEERYRSLVEASSQVVWVASPAGEAVDDAPEWRAITGQSIDVNSGHWIRG